MNENTSVEMLEANNLRLGIVDILYSDIPVLCGAVLHPVDVSRGEPVNECQVPEEVVKQFKDK